MFLAIGVAAAIAGAVVYRSTGPWRELRSFQAHSQDAVTVRLKAPSWDCDRPLSDSERREALAGIRELQPSEEPVNCYTGAAVLLIFTGDDSQERSIRILSRAPYIYKLGRSGYTSERLDSIIEPIYQSAAERASADSSSRRGSPASPR